MELDFVPTRRQIKAARLSVELRASIGETADEDIQAIAAWPLDQAAFEPEPTPR